MTKDDVILFNRNNSLMPCSAFAEICLFVVLFLDSSADEGEVGLQVIASFTRQ